MSNPETPLTPAQQQIVAEHLKHEPWLLAHELVPADQFLARAFGDPVPDETISAWAGRVAVHGHGLPQEAAIALCRVLNHTLSKDHDQKAILADGIRAEETVQAEQQGLDK